jgi:hypothetical protein
MENSLVVLHLWIFCTGYQILTPSKARRVVHDAWNQSYLWIFCTGYHILASSKARGVEHDAWNQSYLWIFCTGYQILTPSKARRVVHDIIRSTNWVIVWHSTVTVIITSVCLKISHKHCIGWSEMTPTNI